MANAKALFWKRFHMKRWKRCLNKITKKKRKLENNLAIKHLFAQSLFLAKVFIGKQFYVMGEI